MKKSLVALAVSISTLLIPSVLAQTYDFPHIHTKGQGEVSTRPDLAVFSVEISHTSKTAKQAKQAVDSAMVALTERLLSQGAKATEIDGANLTLQPEYHYQKDKKPSLTGYRASRTITITVSQLDNLNALLDASLGDSISSINNIALKVSNEAEYIAQARAAAIVDAQTKADALAAGFAKQIEGVWSINYQTASPRPMLMRKMAMDLAVNNADTYQDSRITIRDQIDVVFKLRD